MKFLRPLRAIYDDDEIPLFLSNVREETKLGMYARI